MATSELSVLGTEAVRIATAGHAVFPLKPRQKVPILSEGFHIASTNVKQIRAWWREWPEANIGAPTGITFDALDIDLIDDDVMACIDALGIPFGQGPVSSTGKGAHVFFSPTGLPRMIRFEPNLDWLGLGGYLILPPSIHPNGRSYTWMNGGL